VAAGIARLVLVTGLQGNPMAMHLNELPTHSLPELKVLAHLRYSCLTPLVSCVPRHPAPATCASLSNKITPGSRKRRKNSHTGILICYIKVTVRHDI
jgi:hypothetical protein